jgi:hypothetical protein
MKRWIVMIMLAMMMVLPLVAGEVGGGFEGFWLGEFMMGLYAAAGAIIAVFVGRKYLKKTWVFEDTHEAFKRYIRLILNASSKSGNEQEQYLKHEVEKLPEKIQTVVAKKLNCEPKAAVQKVYDRLTEDARAEGVEDGSGWLKQMVTGLGQAAVGGLAKSLASGLLRKL